MACINTPQLNPLDIAFFNDIMYVSPQFIQFINRGPSFLKAFEKVHIRLRDGFISVNFSLLTSDYRSLNMEISCKGLDWQLSSVGQIFTSHGRTYLRGPLHPRTPTLETRLERPHRERIMAETITTIHRYKKSLLNRGNCITNRTCPGKNVAHPTEYLLGEAQVIGTCSGRHRTVSKSPVIL